MNNTEIKITRWPYLVAGVVMLLLAGIIYAWSILKAPLALEFGWNDAELGLNFTITMCGFCVGGILGGILTKKISPRNAAMIAAVLIFLGFFGSSRLSGEIFHLYLCYGVLSGLGIGITYNVVISTVTRWFPDKRATASGALMMSFGASTLVLGAIMSEVIDISGWRNAYFILGAVIAVVLIACSFLLRFPDARVNDLAVNSSKKVSEIGQDHVVSQMIKTSSFWKVYFLQLLICAIGTGVISMVRDVTLSVGAQESLAVLLVGVLSVCNGLGRIFFGFLFDNIGRRKTMILSCCFAILSCALMLLAVLLSSTAVTVIGLVLVGLTYGSMPPISSGVASSFFGTKNFALNFSVINTMLIPASFSATIAGIMIGATGNYVPVFIMFLCFAFAAFGLNISIKKA